MLRNQWFLFCLLAIVLTFSGVSAGQHLWSGVLDPTRAVDWSQAGATITNRTTVCATLNPGATAAQINSAISSCNNGVVQLTAGTFSLSGSIVTTTSNVTLRGAGSNSTFLVWSATSSGCNGLGQTAICIWNGDSMYVGGPSNVTNWTGGLAKGSTSITLASTSNLKVGSLVLLDQNDFASDPGGIWSCDSCSYEGSGGIIRPGRSQLQNVTVADCRSDHSTTFGAACNTTTITITPAIYSPNWSSSQSPQAWYSSTSPITGVGIENMSIDFSGVNLGMGILFHNATNSWVKGIRSINSTSSGTSAHQHVLTWQSSHITVRDSYFYGSNPQHDGYAVSPSSLSGDVRVENNICQHIAACMVTQGSAGSVFGYNYVVDNYFGGTWQQGDLIHHSAGDNFQLYEGHEGIEALMDDIHGSSWMGTFFRDYFTAYDYATENGTKNEATFGLAIMAYSRYYNVVGTVAGRSGYDTHYENYATAANDCSGNNGDAEHSVFVMGWSDQGGTQYSSACGFSGSIANDLASRSTLMRWGNYIACTGDTACNAVRWQSSETASSDPTYPGLASPSQTLPASFYLSSKPSWWGTMPWPAVGPDVSGGNIANVGGYAYHNPAGNCYLNVMGGKTDGSSGALLFDADTCYGGGTVVAAPTGLVATPH